jgi:apolipoprotein N-acyltransferase
MSGRVPSAASWAWLVLSCALLLLSGGDRPVGIAVWLAPVLLLRFVRDTRPWIGLPVALVALTATSLVADKGMLPVPQVAAVVITLEGSAWLVVPYALDRLLSSPLRPPWRTLVLPACTVAVQTLFGGSGTWGARVYGVQSIHILQVASVLGMAGLAFLVAWSAAVLNEVWEHRGRLQGVGTVVAAYLSVMLVVYGFGAWRLHRPLTPEGDMAVAGLVPPPGHRDTMMQAFVALASPPGAPDRERLTSYMQETFSSLLDESGRLADAGAKLVLWSEGAVVVQEADEPSYADRAGRVAREHGIYLGMGVIVVKATGPRGGQPFLENKLVLVAPDGSVAWQYLKTNLTPGPERQWSIRGDGKLPLAAAAAGRITGAICYDMDFPRHIRQAGQMGASLLLVPANDWPDIRETHWRMARMRAIENGVAVLRPSSSGVSTAVDAYGRVVARADYERSGGGPLLAFLPVGSVPTVYARVGDAWTWACVAAALVLVALGAARRWRGIRLTRR